MLRFHYHPVSSLGVCVKVNYSNNCEDDCRALYCKFIDCEANCNAIAGAVEQ